MAMHTPPMSPARRLELIMQMVRHLQLAAALAHEIGDEPLSAHLFDHSEEQRRLLPQINPDWRFEHPDERIG